MAADSGDAQDGVCSLQDLADALAAPSDQGLDLVQDCSSSFSGSAPMIDIKNRQAMLLPLT